jgi:hypothetical protein
VSLELSDAVVTLQVFVLCTVITALNTVTSYCQYDFKSAGVTVVTVHNCEENHIVNLTCGNRKVESEYGA